MMLFSLLHKKGLHDDDCENDDAYVSVVAVKVVAVLLLLLTLAPLALNWIQTFSKPPVFIMDATF